MALSAYERALRLLGQRQHFRGDLRRKLLAKGYETEEVDEALARCASEGYLDDESTARAFVAERQNRRGLGRARVAAELRRHGASSEAVGAALAEVSDDDERARAATAAARWRRLHRGDASAADPLARRERDAALGRHLASKGFSRSVIVAVLKAGGGEEAAAELEADGGD
ncbi:MAG TPA: regulatory protein RecX [Thermoanaerobaculia bacterium]|jgi:regulatory protein|nr:regulatory protein RecX [Thermoanaerobaculia bacterium]